MTDTGLLVVAADSTHPGWGIAANALGALIGGLIAVLIAIFTVRHETKKQQREDQEARRAQLHRDLVASFVDACSRIQVALRRGDHSEIGASMMWAESRSAQIRMLLHDEGRHELLSWFDDRWKETFMNAADIVAPTPHRARIAAPPDRRDSLHLAGSFLVLEYVCARWSTQPIEKWTSEGPPEHLIQWASAEQAMPSE